MIYRKSYLSGFFVLVNRDPLILNTDLALDNFHNIYNAG